MTTDRERCTTVTKTGQPCKGFRRPGSRYCLAHDPDLGALRAAAVKRGGVHSAHRYRLPKRLPAELEPVYDDVVRALHGVLSGEVGLGQAQAIHELVKGLVLLIETGDQAVTLARLEAVLNGQTDNQARTAPATAGRNGRGHHVPRL
jgi:hypothetical protein